MIELVRGQALSAPIAGMIVARLALGRFLSLAPRRMIHAVACIIHVAIEEQRNLLDVAEDIDARDVRELLAHAVPTLIRASSACSTGSVQRRAISMSIDV
jgi:hypothetical protein